MSGDIATGSSERPRATAAWMTLGIAAVVVLTVGLRWHFFAVPLISDEGAYAYVASLCGPGHRLYRDLPFDRPQGIFLAYQAALLLGRSVFAIRLFAALWSAASAVALLFCTRAVFGWRAGWIAVLLFALTSTAPAIEGFTANAELFVLLPMIASAHAAWRERWLLAGLLGGAAAVLKPSGVSTLLLSLAWALLLPGGRFLATARVAAGFSVCPLLSIGAGAMVSWSGYLSSFLDRRLALHSVASTAAGEQVARLWTGLVSTAPALLVLVLAAVPALVLARGRGLRFGLLFLASIWPGMALGAEWFAHYFQQVVPPLALLGGAGIAALPAGRWRLWGGGAVTLGALLFAASELPFWFAPPDVVSLECFHRPPYLFAEEVARMVQARTRPDEKIYVAVAEPEVYFLSGRRTTATQLFWRELRHGPTLRRTLASIAAGEPALLVFAGPPPGMTVDEFLGLVKRRYRLTDVVGEGAFLLFERRAETASTPAVEDSSPPLPSDMLAP